MKKRRGNKEGRKKIKEVGQNQLKIKSQTITPSADLTHWQMCCCIPACLLGVCVSECLANSNHLKTRSQYVLIVAGRRH